MNVATGDREGFAAFLLRMRNRGLVGKELIAAFESTPRRLFVPGQFHDIAWTERMLPIECGEAIEGVDIQALAIAHLALEPTHRVLEIGTGTGFSAAVIGKLAGRVVTMERYRTLAELARHRMERLGIANVFARQADGAAGLVDEGPFDRIIVWAAFESMPRNFVDQLATNGVMIVPIGPSDGEQMLVKLVKVGSRFERHDLAPVRLQPITASMAQAI